MNDAAPAARPFADGWHMPVIGIGADARVTSWNEAAQHAFGWSEAELRGRPLPWDHDVGEAARRRFEERIAGGLPLRHALARWRRKDGAAAAVRLSAVPAGPEPGPTRYLVLAQHVFRNAVVERDLAALNRRLERQSQALSELARLDPAAAAEFGAAPSPVLRLAAETLAVRRVGLWIESEDRAQVRALQVYDAATGGVERGEVLEAQRYRRYFATLEAGPDLAADDAFADPRTAEYADGYLQRHGIVALLDAPIRIGGRVAGALCCEHDRRRHWTWDERRFVSAVAGLVALALRERELVRANTALIAARNAAVAADRAKGEFLAHMSHELRTPLNAVMGFADLIRSQVLGPLGVPRYREYLEDIHRSARHLLSLIDGLLDFSRSVAESPALVEQEFDAHEAAREAGRAVAEAAARASVALAVETEPGQVMLRGDRRAVTQVLVNLLDNAVKYTPCGGAVRLRAAREPDGGALIEVADTGRGIAPDRLDTVFRPFDRGDPQVAQGAPGVGLGLAISRRLMEAHGGTLALASTPGIGTTARLRFPPRAPIT